MSSASALLALALLAPAQEWRRVEPGLELAFPRDHGAHLEYRTEWWYLTGELVSEGGERFGYQDTVFRSALGERPRPAVPGESPLRARHVLAGHPAVTDVAGGRTLLAERLRRAAAPLARASTEDLDLDLEDWSLRRAAGARLVLAARDPARAIGLELELIPQKPLVLHGERGVSAKGGEQGNASAYVSWTRLAASGRLLLGGAERAVQGSAWFDHEFGSSVLEQGTRGWDWFGLQLDDGRELMLFVLRGADGTAAPASAGTLVAADGTARALSAPDFTVTAQATWTSPRTGARYPARWTLELPAEALRLELVPLVPDAELVTSASTRVTYWEGPVAVRGSAAGRGYAELTGYAGALGGRF